jgi:hypothetical protein
MFGFRSDGGYVTDSNPHDRRYVLKPTSSFYCCSLMATWAGLRHHILKSNYRQQQKQKIRSSNNSRLTRSLKQWFSFLPSGDSQFKRCIYLPLDPFSSAASTAPRNRRDFEEDRRRVGCWGAASDEDTVSASKTTTLCRSVKQQ